jgi:hypothetical protein
MNKRDTERMCAYCADNPAREEDHVIARQFLPNEFVYRDKLPTAPACSRCNRLKQKYEDSAGAILQFGHDSDASRKVLDQRVGKTLRKNARLFRALRDGMHREWLPDKTGSILQERLVIHINSEELFYINQWFGFITKGLYHFEMKAVLPKEYKVYLLKPATQEEFDAWATFILDTKNPQEKTVANCEFKYIFARNAEDSAFTIWLFVFKSVEVLAFTLSPDTPSSLISRMEEAKWELPPPQIRENAAIHSSVMMLD